MKGQGESTTLPMEEALRDLQAKLGQLDVSDDDEKLPNVLEPLSLEGVVKHIKKLQESENSEFLSI